MTSADDSPETLTPAEQVARIREINGEARPDATIIRCDGTRQDLAAYRGGTDDKPGWSLAAQARIGDLVLSSVKIGRDRLVVSLCRVEELVPPNDIAWLPASDVLVASAPLMSDLLEEAGIHQETFTARSGAMRDAIVEALVRLIEHPRTVSEAEQRRSRGRCSTWGRSPLNRQRMLQQSDGRCECCDADLRGRFPDIGEGALEIHHRAALSATSGDRTQTSLDDLAVLCATCHRLVHRVPGLSIDVVAARWAATSARV